jgi:hypothetical protein
MTELPTGVAAQAYSPAEAAAAHHSDDTEPKPNVIRVTTDLNKPGVPLLVRN